MSFIINFWNRIYQLVFERFLNAFKEVELYQFSVAVVTIYHKFSDLNNRNLLCRQRSQNSEMGITGLKLVCQQGTFLPEPIKVIHYLPVSRVQKLLHSLASDSFLHLENQQHSIIRSFSDLAPFLTSSMLSEPQFLQWLPSDNPAQSPFLEVS